jgi:hypothetical protein
LEFWERRRLVAIRRLARAQPKISHGFLKMMYRQLGSNAGPTIMPAAPSGSAGGMQNPLLLSESFHVMMA